MSRLALMAPTVTGVSTLAFAQTNAATDITSAQVQKVLKEQSKATDHTLRVLDLGSYQLGVEVVYRGPTTGAAARRRYGPPPNQAAVQSCGVSAAPAGAKIGPRGMIEHDDSTETYIVISGSGTLVTGGQILNGRRSGPSCSGQAVGDYVSRKMNVGDISVIRAGVAHGWTDITNHVTYLSVRPDPKKGFGARIC